MAGAEKKGEGDESPFRRRIPLRLGEGGTEITLEANLGRLERLEDEMGMTSGEVIDACLRTGLGMKTWRAIICLADGMSPGSRDPKLLYALARTHPEGVAGAIRAASNAIAECIGAELLPPRSALDDPTEPPAAGPEAG